MYTPCTVTISFTKLTNTTSIVEGESKDILVGYGKRELITLRPALPNNFVGFSYRTLSRKGNIRAKVDTNYVYLLPIPAGKTVRTNRMVSANAMAELCHPIGKALPPCWQRSAIVLAEQQ